jgi:hypothetical protein
VPDLSVKLGVGMAVNLLEVDYIRPVEYPEVSCQVELSGYIAEERTGLCQKLEVIYMRACYLYDPESDGVNVTKRFSGNYSLPKEKQK